jgi:hypothetical protein
MSLKIKHGPFSQAGRRRFDPRSRFMFSSSALVSQKAQFWSESAMLKRRAFLRRINVSNSGGLGKPATGFEHANALRL